MELNDLLLLAAASLRSSTNPYGRKIYSRAEAVKEAKLLWDEVLKQDRTE